MERRRIPGGGPEVSEVGFAFDRPLPSDRFAEALLVRAGERGIDLFDLSRAADPGQALRALRGASRGRSLEPVVVVGVPASASRPGAPEGPVPSLRSQGPDRPSNVREIVLLLDPRPEDFGELGTFERLRARAESAGAAAVGVGWESGDDMTPARTAALDAGVRLIAAPTNLLELGGFDRLAPELARRSAGLLALDPHASGRLDGSLLSENPLERSPRDGPLTLEELQKRFAPVARLGFLTSGHRRTLGQAAVRGLVDLPGVVSVLPRFRSVTQVDEFADVTRVPPLGREELRRLRDARGTGPVPDP